MKLHSRNADTAAETCAFHLILPCDPSSKSPSQKSLKQFSMWLLMLIVENFCEWNRLFSLIISITIDFHSANDLNGTFLLIGFAGCSAGFLLAVANSASIVAAASRKSTGISDMLMTHESVFIGVYIISSGCSSSGNAVPLYSPGYFSLSHGLIRHAFISVPFANPSNHVSPSGANRMPMYSLLPCRKLHLACCVPLIVGFLHKYKNSAISSVGNNGSCSEVISHVLKWSN